MEYLPNLRTVPDISRHFAETQPDHVALRLGDQAVTYKELNLGSNQIAQALLAQGLAPGDRTVWLGRNSCRYFEYLIGACKAGVTPTPVNWRLTAFEVEQIITDAKPNLIFTDREFRSNIPAVITGRLPVILTDADASETMSYDGWKSVASTTDPTLDTDPEATCLQIYTSGTTGHPKGAMIAHRSFLALMRASCSPRHGAISVNDLCLVAMPIFHVGGSTYGLNVLYAGATMILHADVNPETIVNDIRNLKIAHAFVVPTVIQMMLAVESADAAAFSSMQDIGYGASPIAQPVLEQAMQQFQCGFRQVYGMTEMTGAITIMTPAEHEIAVAEKPSLLKSCGKTIPGVELRIVDSNGANELPGEIGEIALKGDMMMTGYWGRPDAFADAVRDGWYFSGDAGYLDDDGFLYICDRIKDMIISGGENIYPAEIESVLIGHDGVLDAAVIGVPNEKWGEEVKAFIVANPNELVSAEELITYCVDKLASFKLPKTVEFIDIVPRNGAGKVQKNVLRETSQMKSSSDGSHK